MIHETYKFADGRQLEIIHDDDPVSPREHDNNGIMVCFHNRHNLGDKHDHATSQDFHDWKKEQDVIACLPLYLYDHSGITMNTTGFSCPWDSGQVGEIVATRESLESGGHDVDKLDVAKVEEWLHSEVATYDQYLTGNIYGFILREPPCVTCGGPGEVGDSCWGFYGDNPLENGMEICTQYLTEIAEQRGEKVAVTA